MPTSTNAMSSTAITFYLNPVNKDGFSKMHAEIQHARNSQVFFKESFSRSDMARFQESYFGIMKSQVKQAEKLANSKLENTIAPTQAHTAPQMMTLLAPKPRKALFTQDFSSWVDHFVSDSMTTGCQF